VCLATPALKSHGVCYGMPHRMQGKSENNRLVRQIKFLAREQQFRRAPLRTIGRLISWRIHCLASRGATINLEETELKMCLPPEWQGHAKLIYTFGWRFDPELPFAASTVTAGAVVFDIGANVGAWSLILSQAIGATGKIFAYEPTQSTFEVLLRNVALNSAQNIFTFRYALSDTLGWRSLYHHVDCTRNSLGRSSQANCADYEKVPSTTLDDATAELALDRLDFIKVDVEGAEP
jgi:FkbM family methyltransferase